MRAGRACARSTRTRCAGPSLNLRRLLRARPGREQRNGATKQLLRLLVRTASVETQASNSRGRFPKGSLLLNPKVITSVYGPLRRTYSFRLPGLVRGNEHSASSRAMKPRSGSASLAPTNWFHLIEAGEVVPRLGWGFAERLDGAAQIGQGFPDRNQLAALTQSKYPSDARRESAWFREMLRLRAKARACTDALRISG